MDLIKHLEKYEHRLYDMKKCPNIEKLWQGENKEHYLTEYGENGDCILTLCDDRSIYRFAFSKVKHSSYETVDIEFCETPLDNGRYLVHSKKELRTVVEAMWELEKLFKFGNRKFYEPK